MTQVRAALWDMDGTLVDSADDHWKAWTEVLSEEGYTLTREGFTALFGRRNDDIIHTYLPDCSAERINAISLEKERRYREVVRRDGPRLLPGAGAWLERLAAAGWRQAIATAAPRANADTVVEVLGLGHLFGAIIGAEDVTVGKPDPMVFLLAAQRLGAEPRQSIVLEDAPAGIEAARRAGMKSVGICTLHRDLAADLPVQSFEDLPADAFDRLLAGA
jgi:HAD superfamily hydrolase (TIGR01509 family)